MLSVSLILLSGFQLTVCLFPEQNSYTVNSSTTLFNIHSKFPAIILTNITLNRYIFKRGDGVVGLAISPFTRDFVEHVSESYKSCELSLLKDPQKVVNNLYDLCLSFSNTAIYEEDMVLKCSVVLVQQLALVVQDSGPVNEFLSYQVMDLKRVAKMGTINVLSLYIPAAMTTVSFDGALTRIEYSDFIDGQRYYSVSDSTPEKPGQLWISEKIHLPMSYITPNTMFTTFFFFNVDVDIKISPSLEGRVCEGSIDISQLDGETFYFPPNNGLYDSLFSGSYDCNFNFIPLKEYYVELALLGELNRSSTVRIEGHDGFGVTFSSYPSSSSDYRGFQMNDTYMLPMNGRLNFTSLFGLGSFSFRATFKLFDANKPVDTIYIGGNDTSYLVNMSALAEKQYYFLTPPGTSSFQLLTYAAPSSTSRNYIKQLDNCFVQTTDKMGEMKRYSLREAFDCRHLMIKKSAFIGCMNSVTISGYLLIVGLDETSISLYGTTCARMASSIANTSLETETSNSSEIQSLIVILDDDLDSSTLTYVLLKGIDSLLIINGPLYGAISANISATGPLSYPAKRKITTYSIPARTQVFFNFTVQKSEPVDPPKKTESSQIFIYLLFIITCLVYYV